MKKRKIWALSAIISLGLIIGFSTHDQLKHEPIKAQAGFSGGNAPKVIPDYAGRDPNTDPPYSFIFNPNFNGPQNKYYGSKVRFYEELYRGEFLWYSKVPPADATEADKDMLTMYENRLRRWTAGSCDGKPCYLADFNYNVNLKTGRSEPGKQNYIKGGTTLVVAGPFAGKWMEFRYLGYSFDGNPADNPYFPPDNPPKNGVWEPWKKNWILEPWNKGLTSETAYDQMKEKTQFFIDYFFPANPNFRRPSMSIEADAADWARKFTLQSDPTRSTAIVTGFHSINGKIYYASLLLKTPPQPNLRLITYEVYDKETNKLIGQQLINPDNNKDFKETRNYFDLEGKKVEKATIEKGKTYVIKAKVKNMIVPELGGKDTTHVPIRLNQKYAYDLTSHKYGEWDETYLNSVVTTNPATTIKYGETIDFSKQQKGRGGEMTWEYTVPNEVEKEIVFEADIVEGFKKKRENTWSQDDVGRLRFSIKTEDISIGDALLIDSNGNQVEDVIPNQTYGLRIFVKKFEGDKIVGDPNDPKNPYASIDVEVTDKASVSRTIPGTVAKESLTKQGDMIAIDVPNAITPQTAIVFAKWQIAQKHRDNGQSQIPTNDGWRSKMWSSEVNISVKDFRVKPQAIMRPKEKEAGKENLTFQFQLMNQNKEKQTKDIPYVIRSQGHDIYKGSVSAPANKSIPVSVSIPNVPLFFGEVPFEVEVNPDPRKWIEFKRDGSDPYKDNKANNAVHVYQNQLPNAKCEIVHPQNNWQTTYSLYEWHGHQESYESCTTDKNGNERCRTIYYCVTDWDKSWEETISHYERYEIKNVFFRSKLTDDTQGGWVDILKQPGKVKAGYGFEIKFVVQYKTNSYSAAPKPWRSGCSGKTVSPGWSSVTTPQSITVTMPYTDQSGQPVVYNLIPTSTLGTWDNKTEIYEMPMRNAFNMKNTREIFVNEGARDAKYNIRVDTFPFYGSFDKPPTDDILCDSRQIVLQILGANSDDLKSHVTQ
ncbi:hypothetical protein SMD22_02050 (plasmid) [Brevibacillus halotolerans]|nr:hypothetical protein SMD22_02050 [Brevibacillus halotolerans]